MTLAPQEFIRRFLLHVLPKGFHRIRHYALCIITQHPEVVRASSEGRMPRLTVGCVRRSYALPHVDLAKTELLRFACGTVAVQMAGSGPAI